MTPLYHNRGGYRKLDSFMLATIIYYATVEFCRAHITSARQHEQMTQAARSGRQNIAEGSERSATSRETEIKLTDVARASLAELQLDFEDFINLAHHTPWPDDAPESVELWHLRLARLNPGESSAHHFSKAVAENRALFAKWLNPAEPLPMANALVRLCERADLLLRKQIDGITQRFLEEGGFRENLTRGRLEVRDAQNPVCPQCGKPMQKRKAKSGPHAGKEFWGCTGYGEGCRGTREIE